MSRHPLPRGLRTPLILALFSALWMLCATGRADSAGDFDAANRALSAGRADEAARIYERLTRTGETSAAIERNWALACQQSGLNADALLHLRRAAQLSPRDPDVLNDLRTLRTKLGAATGSESRDSAWIRFLSVDTWGWTALGLAWITGAVAIVRLLRPELRPRLLTGFTSAATATVVATVLAVAAYIDFQSQPNAIVLQPETIVRQSPIDEARPAFTAPAAAELRVRDTRPGWVMGEDPASGRFGWVPRKQLGFVVP